MVPSLQQAAVPRVPLSAFLESVRANSIFHPIHLMEEKKPQKIHTLQELFDAMETEMTANRICYRSNIFKVYMENQSQDILKFVI